MSAFFVFLTTAVACWTITSSETFCCFQTIQNWPTESPTKIISENLSAIFAIGAYDVKQTKGLFLRLFSKLFFFFLKTLL